MKKHTLAALVLLFVSVGLKAQDPEAVSFTGKPLHSPPADPKASAKADSIIAAVRSKPALGEDDYVEIGKQLAAVGRYKKAIENYTEALKKFPNSYKLLRYRGHRYINVRMLDNAFADLNRAAKLIQSQPEVYETDAQGKPTATYLHNTWYHIGVYYYLKGDYKKCADAFEKCIAAAHESNNTVGASDWLYNAYQRSGQKDKAENVIKSIPTNYDDAKGGPYYGRVLLYKGVNTPEKLIDVNMDPSKMAVADITKMYGLANWYRYQGNKAKSRELCEKILKSTAWPGFAYAGAEKDLMEK